MSKKKLQDKAVYLKIGLAVVFVSAIALFFIFGFHKYLTLDMLKSQRQAFQAYYTQHTILTLVAFVLTYTALTALSVPGAAVLTLAAGALFGFWTGLVLVSFASAFGATLAFLSARFVLHDWVKSKFGARLKKINQGVKKEGAFYLFTLRLIPLFPFALVNLLMGLTEINTALFYIASQVGMLPGTALFVYAGTQLAEIKTLSDVLSPGLIAAFVAIGILPLAAKKGYERWRGKKA